MLLVAGEDCARNHVPINRCSSDAKSSQLVLARVQTWTGLSSWVFSV